MYAKKITPRQCNNIIQCYCLTDTLPSPTAKHIDLRIRTAEALEDQKTSSSHISVVIPVLVLLLVLCIVIATLCTIIIKKKYHGFKHSGQLQMTNCKPTLAAMLSRENRNAFLFITAPNFIDEFDSDYGQEPISRQMANVSFFFFWGRVGQNEC